MRYPAIDVRGAVVAITGGARGIGRATAEEFASRGASVCVGDLDSAEFPLDVTNRESFDAFTAAVTDRFGRIDVLVNNAGVMPLGDFLEEPDAVGRTTLAGTSSPRSPRSR
ncbi:MAG TPA: SDR family NAD(P)-dependent oxidoreductase [Streptomyces sp.]